MDHASDYFILTLDTAVLGGPPRAAEFSLARLEHDGQRDVPIINRCRGGACVCRWCCWYDGRGLARNLCLGGHWRLANASSLDDRPASIRLARLAPANRPVDAGLSRISD